MKLGQTYDGIRCPACGGDIKAVRSPINHECIRCDRSVTPEVVDVE